MVNSQKIKGRIVELGKNQADCAAALGIRPPTFNQKLNNVRSFTLSESEVLRKFLDIDDSLFAEYFFCRASSISQHQMRVIS